jgi:hypothetical protein
MKLGTGTTVAEQQPMQVVMCEATAQVPREILHAVEQRLEETAQSLAQMDPESTLWTSLRESGLSLEVLGWRFTVSVEADKLMLTGAEPIPAHVT